jgi:Radical SAM superfamily/Iron-sulfur cluster-binding domain
MSLDFPSKIQIQTADRCNYLCPMCPYPELSPDRPALQLPEPLFRRLIDEVRTAKRKVKLCLMLQNEPFLDKRFLDFLDYAHGADDAVLSVSTVTNGSVLTDDLLDRLLAYERFHLTISVNATERERYQRIHGRDFWDRIHTRLMGWSGPRQRVRLSFVLDRSSIEEARAFQSYWRDAGYGTRLVPINSRTEEAAPVDRVHVVEEDFGHCHYPVDTLNVLVDGRVILCCNDWRHDTTYGDLSRQTIAEVWNGPQLTRMRDAAIAGRLRESPMCRGCDYPIRSTQRLQLEGLVSGRPVPAPLVSGGVTPHPSRLRLAGGEVVPVLVWKLDPLRGTAGLLMQGLPPAGAVPAALEFVIGHHRDFNFGSLEPMWCPGELRGGEAVADMHSAELRLDRDAEEFRFLPWYEADWAPMSAQASAERGTTSVEDPRADRPKGAGRIQAVNERTRR